jgi:outer membrane protein OmpA-like peptidoglycan-associated protein
MFVLAFFAYVSAANAQVAPDTGSVSSAPPALLGVSANPVAGNTAVGQAEDPPVVAPRFPGASVVQYEFQPIDSRAILLAPYGENPNGPLPAKKVDGDHTVITYQLPGDTPLIAAEQYYQKEVQKAGGGVAYSCDNSGCGRYGGGTNGVCSSFGEHFNLAGYMAGHLVVQHFLTTPIECHYFVGYVPAVGSDGDVYVAVFIYDQQRDVSTYDNQLVDRHRTVTVMVDVVEARNFAVKPELLDADSMQASINISGKVALYGIYFDSRKFVIKSASVPALQQIAKLMSNNPTLHVLIVGHTDSQGDYQANMTLSMNRALAVVHALENDYNVSPARLKAVGDGMTAPVATNDTDAGRALNRRVELVKD